MGREGFGGLTFSLNTVCVDVHLCSSLVNFKLDVPVSRRSTIQPRIFNRQKAHAGSWGTQHKWGLWAQARLLVSSKLGYQVSKRPAQQLVLLRLWTRRQDRPTWCFCGSQQGWLHQHPVASAPASSCVVGMQTETHAWLNPQSGKQLPHSSVWDKDSSSSPGT